MPTLHKQRVVPEEITTCMLTVENDDTKRSVIWGDPIHGPAGVLFKFPAGYRTQMHYHKSDYHAFIVSGKSKRWILGEEEPAEADGPGTCWFQPADQIHCAFNPGSEPVTIFIYFPNGSDFIPVE